MTQGLVVCADDYALNPGVSAAIAELAYLGRISATSVMVCSPHWPALSPDLQALRGRIGVGLHLDLTSPWAVQAGHGQSLGSAMAGSALRFVDAKHTLEVIEAQLDRFEQVWQAPPDHIDGHQHVQQFPVWRDALVAAVARRYPAGQRPWLRVSQPGEPGRGFKAWLIGAMGARALAGAARRHHIPACRGLVGITDFAGDDRQWLAQAEGWLRSVASTPGLVLMCHPGRPDADASDGIAAAREQEYRALASPAWPALLQRHGIHLTPSPSGQESEGLVA
jgi:predicted glycoside hydrolase/deacetylase ChbG (UPF0249 family)